MVVLLGAFCLSFFVWRDLDLYTYSGTNPLCVVVSNNNRKAQAAMPLTAEEAGVPNVAAAYLKSLEDPEVIERVRCSIPDAHVFKLPHRPTAGGWRLDDAVT